MKVVDFWDEGLDKIMPYFKEEIMLRIKALPSEEAEKIKSIPMNFKFETEEEFEKKFAKLKKSDKELYEYAKTQGYQGSYVDFVDDNKQFKKEVL